MSNAVQDIACKLCNSKDVAVIAETRDKEMRLCHTCDRIHYVTKN